MTTDMDRLVAFGFGNGEMRLRPYLVEGNSLRPMPGVRTYGHPSGTYGTRDPAVARIGGRYVAASTRPLLSDYLGNSTHLSIATSETLVSWKHLRDIPSGLAGTTRCWAPEWFLDSDGRVYLYYSVSPDNMATFDIYCLRMDPLTLAPIGTPVKMDGLTGGTSPTIKVIDAQVTRVGSELIMFVKDEVHMQIMRARAVSPLGPWTLDRTGNWLDIVGQVEGPQLVRYPHGWRLFYDRYSAPGGGQLAYKDSVDLDNWSSETELNYSPPDLRHLGLLWLSAGEWTAFRAHPRRVSVWTGVQEMPNSPAMGVVRWTNVVDDPEMFTFDSPTRLKAIEAGTFTLHVEFGWEANGAGQRSLAYRVNTGAWRWLGSQNATGGGFGTEQNVTAGGVYLNSSDYIEVGCLQNSGVPLDMSFAAATLVRGRGA